MDITLDVSRETLQDLFEKFRKFCQRIGGRTEREPGILVCRLPETTEGALFFGFDREHRKKLVYRDFRSRDRLILEADRDDTIFAGVTRWVGEVSGSIFLNADYEEDPYRGGVDGRFELEGIRTISLGVDVNGNVYLHFG
ncbi:MAG: hypothetical protein DRG69_07695 [Deltaproteobacteria bacterium]|nr:MAG: hypothetical protein DRG69_07695 [Deltaproteobacteria bacterium]